MVKISELLAEPDGPDVFIPPKPEVYITADGKVRNGKQGRPRNMPSNAAMRVGAAKVKLLGWARYVDKGYKWPKHIKYLAAILEAVEKGELKKVIIQMPPRHGKSRLTSIRFPSWYIGRNPTKRVILAAHTADLAHGFSKTARDEFNMFAPEVFGFQVSKGSSAAHHWEITDKDRGTTLGGMLAAGIAGPITGQGADLFVIDDPIKTAEEAYSKLKRDKVWDWHNFVVRTRLQPNAAEILCLTRWHEDDLAGRLIKEGDWKVVSFPAIAEELDELSRQEGDALWPEQYPAEVLLKAKKNPMVWSALYQQRPAPLEGGIIKRKWLKFYKRLPSNLTDHSQSWDTAFKSKSTGSFVVGQAWARKDGKFYLLDQFREHVDFVGTIAQIIAMTKKHPRTVAKLIEDTANGPAIISTLQGKISGIIPITVKGSKEARASAISPLFQAGDVYLPDDPEEHPWVLDLIEELVTFPNAPKDDQMDCTTQMLQWYQDQAAENTWAFV